MFTECGICIERKLIHFENAKVQISLTELPIATSCNFSHLKNIFEGITSTPFPITTFRRLTQFLKDGPSNNFTESGK